MPGVTALQKIQLGREVTPGTSVAATTVWRGVGTAEDLREVRPGTERVGLLPRTTRFTIPKLYAEIAFEDTEATFEQLLHIGEAGIKTIGTGVADGSGSGKIYDYAFPTTAQPTTKFYSIRGGDDNQAELMEYAFVRDFELKGEAGAPVMVNANWGARQLADSTFTGAISIPTVEDILFQLGKIYIDDAGGVIGTTQKTNTWLDFSFKYKTGLTPVWTGDGNKYFSLVKAAAPEATLDFTFEFDATAVAERTKWRNETARLIQLKFEGSTFALPGTAYSKKTVKLNLAGYYTKWEKIGEKDGNDVIAAKFNGAYDSGLASMGSLIVVPTLATVP